MKKVIGLEQSLNVLTKNRGIDLEGNSDSISKFSKEIFGLEWAISSTNLTDEYYQKPYGYNQEGRKFNLSLRSKY